MTNSSDYILSIFGGCITIIAAIGTYHIIKYFKKLELSARRREIRQETYFMKHDATIYALAISLDKATGESFNKNYHEKLKELQHETDRIHDMSRQA